MVVGLCNMLMILGIGRRWRPRRLGNIWLVSMVVVRLRLSRLGSLVLVRRRRTRKGLKKPECRRMRRRVTLGLLCTRACLMRLRLTRRMSRVGVMPLRCRTRLLLVTMGPVCLCCCIPDPLYTGSSRRRLAFVSRTRRLSARTVGIMLRRCR